MRIAFRHRALVDLDQLDAQVRARIIRKLEWYATQADPLCFATALSRSELGGYRFRIGDWRVIADTDAEESTLIILRIGHRREIYR